MVFTGITFKQLRTVFLGGLSKTEAVKCYKNFIEVLDAPRELFPSEADFNKVFYKPGGCIPFVYQYVTWVANSGSLPTGKQERLASILI